LNSTNYFLTPKLPFTANTTKNEVRTEASENFLTNNNYKRNFSSKKIKLGKTHKFNRERT
jgi:hypothetical protein